MIIEKIVVRSFGILKDMTLEFSDTVNVIEGQNESGKSTVAAFRAGFKNAFSSIIDSNVTTMIAVIVLLVFGTGSIVGFAQTLLIGILVSMFTALLVTRNFLHLLVGMHITAPTKWGMWKKDMELRKEALGK